MESENIKQTIRDIFKKESESTTNLLNSMRMAIVHEHKEEFNVIWCDHKFTIKYEGKEKIH